MALHQSKRHGKSDWEEELGEAPRRLGTEAGACYGAALPLTTDSEAAANGGEQGRPMRSVPMRCFLTSALNCLRKAYILLTNNTLHIKLRSSLLYSPPPVR